MAWLEIGRDVYNYTLPEINEWIASCLAGGQGFLGAGVHPVCRCTVPWD
ncbi:hypothetical protein CYB_2840 [Synechococcus sp. JA-2-3B'a(2-13)]|nr:hypothetical protein CYB_2840 [Synechococcus sp. JA-2-3B'a(2-13)]